MRKKIVLFTHVSFLDTAVEHIKIAAENGFDINVFIGVPPNGHKSNILNLDIDLEAYPSIVSFDKIKNKWDLNFLSPYFQKCVSVDFILYPLKKSESLSVLTSDIKNLINKISPDFIHLDEFMTRQYPLLPFLFKNRAKLIMNIHDPNMHSGEFDIKRYIFRKILFKMISKFVVFANDSKEALYPQLSKKKYIYILNLRASSIYRNFNKNFKIEITPSTISFVGRISKYKGIDLFIDAINIVHKEFPEQKFVISGKPVKNFEVDYSIINNKENVIIIEKFLSNEEITELILNAKLVVCPYIDASQSGIILISHGLKRPVLVTPVGGLPDYIIENENGLVAKAVTADSLANAITSFLSEEMYERMRGFFNDEQTLKLQQAQYVSDLKEIYC